MRGLARFAFFTWLPLEQEADDFSLALREQTGASASGFKSTHDQVEALRYHSPDLNPGRLYGRKFD